MLHTRETGCVIIIYEGINMFTIYTDKFLPEGVAGRCVTPFTNIIKPKYKEDTGLYEHELIHTKQWWVTIVISIFIIFPILYYFNLSFYLLLLSFLAHPVLTKISKYYRLNIEAMAYAKQAKIDIEQGKNYDYTLNLMSYRLALPLYSLDIDINEAKENILKYM